MKRNKTLKILIIILAILLGLSATALTGTLLYNRFVRTEPTTVDVPGNIITPDGEDNSSAETTPPPFESANGEASSEPDTSTVPDQSETTSASEAVPETTESETTGTTSVSSSKASAIALHNRKPEDNTPFQVTNMFPGDRETKYYCVKVSYKGDIIVRYHADIRPGYEKLAEVLKVKIRLPETDETLYAPEIELGINLVATQTPYENDSFGNNYDENAEYPIIPIKVATADELITALQSNKRLSFPTTSNSCLSSLRRSLPCRLRS